MTPGDPVSYPMTLSSSLCGFSVTFQDTWSSFTPHVCILPSRKEKEKGKDMPSFFMTTSGSNIYHFHFHPMVDSVTSNISEETGQHGLHSGQWCPLLSVNNMEVLLLKKWKADIEAGRIIVPQTYPHPNSQSIPVHMLFFMEKRLCSKNLELGRFSWSIQVGPI